MVESFKHYPSFDEGEVLSLAGNFARYGKYQMQFFYHDTPNLFNPGMSIGPPFIMLLALLVKTFGYHFYVVNLGIFFLVSIPLIFLLLFLLNILLPKKISGLTKLLALLVFYVFLVTNRLFYSSPPTGGSFTHGPIGEPFSLLSILMSNMMLFFALKKEKITLAYFAGFFSALAYETKNISIIFCLSQIAVFILIIVFAKLAKNQKITKFYLKNLLFFGLGVFTLVGGFWIWERLKFTRDDYIYYSCWKKAVFISMGSGSKNLFDFSLSRLNSSFNNAATVLTNFFADNIGAPWGVHNKFIIISFFVLMFFFLLREAVTRFYKFFSEKAFINRKKIPNVFIELSLILFFWIGSIWFFFVSELQWIRHYYIFIFIGFLFFYFVLINSFKNKILLNISLVLLGLFFIIFRFPKSPLTTSYHLREVLNYNLEDVDNDFINFYKDYSNEKTYVCGIFKMQTVTFLAGYNFFNNVIEDSESVYPKCDFMPKPRIRDDLEKHFLYINLANNTYYPECIEFFEKNKDNFTQVYSYGNGVYEMRE